MGLEQIVSGINRDIQNIRPIESPYSKITSPGDKIASIYLGVIYMPIKIIIEVIETRGQGCDQGFKQGDIFELKEQSHSFCCNAYNSIYPVAQVLRYGGRFPWETEKGVEILGCPDPYNTVVFKIKAVDDENSTS